MRKLLLVNPVGRKSGYMLSRFTRFQPMGLGYVAAVTPPGWDIELIDENIEPFRFKPADLVAITAFSSNINRAYDIARVCRDNGVTVVLGGIHVSMAPEEALAHGDSIVVGEVENVWPQVIADVENNCLARRYDGPMVDMTRFNITPRRDLFDPSYLWQSVQTSRGCPFDCSFCSVTRHLGSAYRKRPARNVLEELEQIQGKYIAFVDDNLIGYGRSSVSESKQLFQGMIDRQLNKTWWMQTSMNAAADEEVISLAARAGCVFAFIGFETIDTRSLTAMKKGVNLKTGVDNYKTVIQRFHKHGIGVMGAFILGNDYESKQYYKDLGRFMVRSGVDIFQISILTPLPGTRLMDTLVSENRLIHHTFPSDWDKYRFSYMVHQPKGVTPDTVYTADNYLKKQLYRFPGYPLRLVRSLLHLKNLTSFAVTYKLNQALKKSWKNSHYFRKYPTDL
ncbi:MAG: radical SAM protein [Desulfobacteraceae bacterium]|nr:MAG: radical SAM protein [Desulfobacteraceae bacterium]